MDVRTHPSTTVQSASIVGRLSLDGVWAFAAIAVATLVGLLGRLSAIDLTYHLRAGQAILSTHRLLGTDTYTFTAAGRPWLDQQWGAQVLMALVYRVGGFPGLSLFRGALVGLTFWFLWKACRARGTSARTASVLTIAGLVVGFLNTGMRPQTVAYPLFTGTLWILADRHTHPRRLWFLPPIALLWANLHGSFLVLPLVIALAVIEDVWKHDRVARTTMASGLAAIATTLINPFGVGAWRYAIGLTTNTRILDQIVEWQPTTIRTAAGALFFASALAVAAVLVRRAAPTDPIDLLWLGAFFVLALPALRGIVWWAFVFPFALAGLPPREHARDDRSGDPRMNILLVSVLAASLVVALPWWRGGTDPMSGGPALLASAPQGLVRATVGAVPSGGRVLVSQPYASWFEFAAPSLPVFVDSRIELFPDRVWIDYLNVMQGRDGWQTILDRWDIDGVVLRTEDSELRRRIADDPGWRAVYRDEQGTLFVRV